VNYFLAILAGAVQGLTEFLPVSSTGHLIIFEKIFGISQQEFGLAFDASLHLGTLLAVLLYFFRDYLKIFDFRNKLYLKLIVGTIPAAIFGLLFDSKIESSIRELWIVGIALIVFSFVIILSEKYGSQNKSGKKITTQKSFLIGLAQSIALIPGISRSGATISAGLFLGLTREEAARFAFILSGPIIAGAGTLKFLHIIASHPQASDLNFFLIGIASSAIFGFLTIKYFLKYLSTKTLYPFVVYRIILGIILLLTIFR